MASSDGDGENSSEDAVEDRHLRLTRVLSSDEDDDDDEEERRSLVRAPLPRGLNTHGRLVLALSGFRGFSMSSGGRVGRSTRPRRLSSVIATRATGRAYGSAGGRHPSILDRARARSPVVTHLTTYRSCGRLARPIALPAFPRWHHPLLISTSSNPPLASLGRDSFQLSERPARADADHDDVMEDEALADEDYEGEDDDDEEHTRYRLTSSDESVDMVFEVEDDAETDEAVPGENPEEEDEEGEEEEEEADEVAETAASDEEDEAVEEDEEDEDGDHEEEEEEEENEGEEESTPAGTQETTSSHADTMETEEGDDEEDGEDGEDQEDEEEEEEEDDGEQNASVTLAEAAPPASTAVSDIPLPSSSPPSTEGPAATPEQQLGLVGSLLEILECPVCYEPMRPPIWQCSRGHMVCKDCAPRLKRCPTCRCTARRSRNCTMEKVCAQLRYPCRFHQRGCGVTLPPGELDGHELAACAFRDSACRVPRCSWRGVDAQLRAHARAAHAALSKAGRAGAPVTMRVPVWGSAMRHCRLLDHASHVFFVHFLVDAGTLSGCVQLFGSAAHARDIEYRMELDERAGRGSRAHQQHHQLYQHRDAMQRVADIQERISYFQARLRHSVSSEGGGGGAGGPGTGILEASTWTWARVLGVDEDPEHALRGGRAWRVDLGRARRLTSHSRFAKTRVRVTVQPVLRPGHGHSE